jgi:hypothetical protein
MERHFVVLSWLQSSGYASALSPRTRGRGEGLSFSHEVRTEGTWQAIEEIS